MSININGGNNLTDMFKSIFGAANSGSSSFLSNYASIRNGSYRKLMNAYYDKKDSNRVSSGKDKDYTSTLYKNSIRGTGASAVDGEGLSEAKSVAQSMQSSLTTLMDRKKNVFKKDENGNYDVDKIYNAVNSFVKSYNDMLNVSDTLDDERTLDKILSMARYTSSNRSALAYSGITFNDRSEMVLDKDKFSKMDMNAIKNMFQGTGSYASQMLSRATNIQSAAKLSLDSASGIYGSSGSYENYFNTGSIYKGWF